MTAPAHVRSQLFIGGDWHSPHEPELMAEIVSPSTETPFAAAPRGSTADVDAAVRAARTALKAAPWAGSTGTRRAAWMRSLADELESRGDHTAVLVSGENGMPISLARVAEGKGPAGTLRYYADLAEQTPAEERRPSARGGRATVVRREPVGVVAAVVPWNFPQSLTMFKVAPALAAGCTVVIKPAPETAVDAFALADAAQACGFPPGVINVITGGRDVGAYLVAHPGIHKVAFTGSTAAGRAIGEVCGRLQTCYLSSRVLAPRSRYAEVVDAVADLAGSLKVGDPFDPSTRVGPLVTRLQRDRVEGFISAGRSEGARVVTGGGRPEHLPVGWYVEPTVLADLAPHSTPAREEIFGPVLVVLPYDDIDDAIRLANDSEYGLGGTVWTRDVERGLEIARRVETGSIGVNFFDLDLGAPFGGVKSSGLGRELGPEGLDTYVSLKSVYLPG